MVQISEALPNGAGAGACAGADKTSPDQLSKARMESDWPTVLFFIHVHLLSIFGLWLFCYEIKYMTLIFFILLVSLGILGVTAGAHRLWAHRTYKANLELRVALMLCQTLAGQGPIYEWVQYHRSHHAHHGTTGDPFDYNKGFFYAHVLSRIYKLSPYQQALKDAVDMSDMESDSVVMFQKKWYWLLYGVLFLLLPLNAPMEYWGESVLSAVFVIGFLRYGVLLHAAWLVESGICIWGLQPGDKYPHDSNSVFLLTKTFWPHYHYLVPYDYKSGEFGKYDGGCTTAFIRIFAALGLARDLRTVEAAAIQEAMVAASKTGRPLGQCLQEAVSKQKLPVDHYLKRD